MSRTVDTLKVIRNEFKTFGFRKVPQISRTDWHDSLSLYMCVYVCVFFGFVCVCVNIPACALVCEKSSWHDLSIPSLLALSHLC